MIRHDIDDQINTIDDRILFLKHKINRAINDLDRESIVDSGKTIVSLILRREDLMSIEINNEKTIENHIENDKIEIELAYSEGDLAKAHHLEGELASLEQYHEAHPEDHHDPTPLELYCDANPSAPECLVYDD